MSVVLAVLLSIIFTIGVAGLVGGLVVDAIRAIRRLRGKESSDRLFVLSVVLDKIFVRAGIIGGFLALYLLMVFSWTQV